MRSDLRWLRIAGLLEGCSWLALITTMILKYGFNRPEPNIYTGYIHGFLFIAYGILLVIVHFTHRFSLFRTTWKLALAALLPFATFYTDQKYLARHTKNRSTDSG